MDYRIIATTDATDAQLDIVDCLNEVLAIHEYEAAEVEAEAARLRDAYGIACSVEAYDGAADFADLGA
jgi:hypothetical protein